MHEYMSIRWSCSLEYLWNPEVTDVLKLWTYNRKFALHPLILTPHSLHFLSENKETKRLEYNLLSDEMNHLRVPLLGLFWCAPRIRHTFWPGSWPALPGAKPSGWTLLPVLEGPDSSTPPAAVGTLPTHTGRCPARRTKSLFLWSSHNMLPQQNRRHNTLLCMTLAIVKIWFAVILIPVRGCGLVEWSLTLSIWSCASSTDRDCSSLSQPHNLVSTACRGKIKMLV